jgi:hypothetical protein
LLYQAQGVHVEPMLDALAARDADDIDRRARHVLAGWGDAHKRPLMRATRSQAGHNLVPFCDHVFNRELQIRESRQVHADGLFGSLAVSWQTRRERVIDLIGGDEFIDGSQILLVELFFVLEERDRYLLFFLILL